MRRGPLSILGWMFWIVVLGFAEASVAQETEPEVSEAAPAAETRSCAVAERSSLDFRLDAEAGGGVVEASACSIVYNPSDKHVLAGDVEILYQDVKVQADRLELFQETSDVRAEGRVIFDQGPQRLIGALLELNLDTKIGHLTEAQGSMGSDYFFRGANVEKLSEDHYRIFDGTFTSCEAPVPPWSFRASRIDVTVDGYAKARGTRLRIKKAPVFYLPYLLWPVRADRSSGFLVPKPGYSSRRGAHLGLAYFWAINRSYDTTFQLDLFGGGAPEDSMGTGSYLGYGQELRYHPSEGTKGHFEGYAIRDPELDDVRWRVRYEHESRNLPLGLRAVVKVEDVSDFDFFQDFDRRTDRNSRRQLYSNAYLSGNWGAHSLNILFDRRENFLSDERTIELRQLPEIEYKLRSSRLGKSPFYLQLRSSLHYFDVNRSELLDEQYGRADLQPELTLPIRSKPWLSLSLSVGGQLTWYQKSLLTDAEKLEQPERESDFRAESLFRTTPFATAEIVGPSFSRIIQGGGKRFGRFKHVIEPRFAYSFLEEDEEDRDRVPLFDELDRVRGRNVGRVSLFNRLLAKPAGDGGGAFEILSFELSQDFSFDDEQPLQSGVIQDGPDAGMRVERSAGPVRALFRFNPSRRTSLRTEVVYNTLFARVEATALSGSLGLGQRSNIGLRWTTRVNPASGETNTDQVRLASRFPIVPRRLIFQGEINYDIERSIARNKRFFLTWNGSCFSVNTEFAQFKNSSRRDQEFRFSVTFKNVGTFLDITGGESEDL